MVVDIGKLLKLIRAGKMEKALEFLEGVPEYLRNAFFEALVGEAAIYHLEERYELETEHLEVASRIVPDDNLKSGIFIKMSISYYEWGSDLFDLSELESDPSEKKELLLESCKKYEKAVDVNPDLAEAYFNWGVSLFYLSELESDPSEKKELLLESCKKYEKAMDINPHYVQAYSNWGNSLSGLSRLEDDPSKKKELLLESCKKYKKAADSNLAEAYSNWGASLFYLSELESDPSKKKELLLESCKKYEKEVNINSNYAEAYFNWGVSLFYLSRLESDPSEKKELLLESCKKYEKAMDINPHYAEAYFNWGNSLSNLSELESDLSKKKELLLESCKKCEKAVDINPDYVEAYSNWGSDLFDLSRLESDPSKKKESLLESCKKYEKAVDVNPDLAEAYSNWGNSLSNLSELESDPSEKKELLLESCKKYEKAVDVNPHYVATHFNWGIVLLNLSEFEDDPSEKKELLLESCSKFEKIVNINSNYAEVYFNWGIGLLSLSELESDPFEKKELLLESCKKCEKAVDVNPHYAEAYFNWGVSLFYLSELESDPSKKKELLLESCKKYEKAVDVNPDCAEAFANRGITLLLLNTHLSTAEECFTRASYLFREGNSAKMRAFREWTRARSYMNKRKWEQFRERMLEAKRIFEGLGDPLAESVSASVEFSYVDEELERTLEEMDAMQALEKLATIFQNLPELSSLSEPERAIYKSRLTIFEIIRDFIITLLNIDNSTDLSHPKRKFEELLVTSQRVETECELVHFSFGKRAIVDIACMIENNFSLLENLRSVPGSMRKNVISIEIKDFWERTSAAISLLDGEWSTRNENLIISRQLSSIDRRLATVQNDMTERRRLGERTLELIEETRNLVVQKDIVSSEYIFEIREPLILQSFLPYSNKLRISVKLGTLTNTDICNLENSIKRLNAKGRRMIAEKLEKLKGVDKRLLEMLKGIRSQL
jgi:Fe-S-cluster formation regulator IscX/YfhJ